MLNQVVRRTAVGPKLLFITDTEAFEWTIPLSFRTCEVKHLNAKGI